jgi:Uma2 family endonuclease
MLEPEKSLLRDLPVRRFTVAEYHRMARAGIFQPDERVELLEGRVVPASPQGEPHARPIVVLNRLLIRVLGEEYEVRPQLPLTLGRYSEPEPDLAVVHASELRGPRRHPATARLVVESADSTLSRDRLLKGRIYARAGIPEYWLVRVPERAVEVFREPDVRARRYRSAHTYGEAEMLTAQSLPGVSVQVSALFG